MPCSAMRPARRAGELARAAAARAAAALAGVAVRGQGRPGLAVGASTVRSQPLQCRCCHCCRASGWASLMAWTPACSSEWQQLRRWRQQPPAASRLLGGVWMALQGALPGYLERTGWLVTGVRGAGAVARGRAAQWRARAWHGLCNGASAAAVGGVAARGGGWVSGGLVAACRLERYIAMVATGVPPTPHPWSGGCVDADGLHLMGYGNSLGTLGGHCTGRYMWGARQGAMVGGTGTAVAPAAERCRVRHHHSTRTLSSLRSLRHACPPCVARARGCSSMRMSLAFGPE